MLASFLLGLTGSLGHCLGMCSSVALILGRRGAARGWRLLVAHLGRVTTYSALGGLAGLLGHSLQAVLPHLRPWQGFLALVAAGLALYLALALLGRVPAPETYLTGLSGRWGRAMRLLTDPQKGRASLPGLYLLGLLWGLLPCGLVLTALLAAAVTASPTQGALAMLLFGVGTWPALLGVGLVARHGRPRPTPWLRPAAALVVLLFGAQMALRGLATWGWLSHLHLGGIMLW